MIADAHAVSWTPVYDSDKAVEKVIKGIDDQNPQKELSECQTIHYLYESLALAPWLGKETAEGPEMPLDKDYM